MTVKLNEMKLFYSSSYGFEISNTTKKRKRVLAEISNSRYAAKRFDQGLTCLVRLMRYCSCKEVVNGSTFLAQVSLVLSCIAALQQNTKGYGIWLLNSVLCVSHFRWESGLQRHQYINNWATQPCSRSVQSPTPYGHVALFHGTSRISENKLFQDLPTDTIINPVVAENTTSTTH